MIKFTRNLYALSESGNLDEQKENPTFYEETG